MNELLLVIIHLFDKYLLSTHYEAGPVLGKDGTKMSKTRLLFLKHPFSWH